MKPTFHHHRRTLARRQPGFALVVTLSLLILLVILATGLLSLSAISLRSAGASESNQMARANARLAVLFAIAELQKSAGDDRRITADAGILDSAAQPHLVGVWDSWSPDFRSDPNQGGSSYDAVKEDNFRGWLVSHPDPLATLDRDFANQSAGGADGQVEVFTADADGYELGAARVPVPGGAYAWAVSQEGTKAKITVAGPETNERNPNDDIQAQARPNLALSDVFEQPTGDWNSRSAKVVSMGQAGLDEALSGGPIPAAARLDFTAHSMGLLTDVVNGGLKTDLSLGFEMSDSDFDAPQWGDITNPFTADAAGFSTSLPPAIISNYKNQRPLFRPLTPTATHTARLDQFEAARVRFDYPGAGVPTFHSLRSFYRIPYHLYSTPENGVSVFERAADHVAFKSTPVPGGLYPTPWAPPRALETQSSIRPVVDRVMFLLSAGLTPNSEPSLVITPVITMWNPYNVALEIEGAVAYPWLDVPFNFDFIVYGAGGQEARRHGHGMAGLLGRQFQSWPHGRSVDPYFYAAITDSGARIPATGTVEPIRFKPGEVRIFVPTSPAPRPFQPASYGSNYKATVNITGITTYLRPVENLGQFSTKGGLSVPLSSTRMQQGEEAQIHFRVSAGEDYPAFISVEDATRAKGNSATNASRGQAIVDVLQRYFGQSGEFGQGNERGTGFRSIRVPWSGLIQEPSPFAVLEFYHRYAQTGAEQAGDLVFTGNPRQPWMAHYMTNATFPSGPQYKLRVRGPVTTFSGLLEVAPNSGGRTALYGASNRADTSPGGRSQLAFFEIPRAPLLSLAAFQHADLSATPFGPANQFANSWASAYITSARTSLAPTGMGESARPPIYDTSYLTNEALWDGFFFSGASAEMTPGSAAGGASSWDAPVANVTRTTDDVVEAFVRDPDENPLRNPRMRLVKGGVPDDELIADFQEPEGCVKIAGHLMVDGAFNVNSTSVQAWTAVLAGLRGTAIDVEEGPSPDSSATAFPRFRNPVGSPNDHWHGFRTLTDAQIETLAENIVEEVRERGPFLSLAEFVNRRILPGPPGVSGALQSAIDSSALNNDTLYDDLDVSSFPITSRRNIAPAKTGVGIPGYLTQADVLQSLAPVITVRSDTFTVRGYGEARDNSGRIVATAWCEAVVQRKPAFVDPSNPPHTAIEETSETNQTFGRRFSLVSFRYLSPEELREVN